MSCHFSVIECRECLLQFFVSAGAMGMNLVSGYESSDGISVLRVCRTARRPDGQDSQDGQDGMEQQTAFS